MERLKMHKSKLTELQREIVLQLKNAGLDSLYKVVMEIGYMGDPYLKIIDQDGLGVTIDYNTSDGFAINPSIETSTITNNDDDTLPFVIWRKDQIKLMQSLLEIISKTKN